MDWFLYDRELLHDRVETGESAFARKWFRAVTGDKRKSYALKVTENSKQLTQTFIGESDTKVEDLLLKFLCYSSFWLYENQVHDANKCLVLYIHLLILLFFFNSLQNGVNYLKQKNDFACNKTYWQQLRVLYWFDTYQLCEFDFTRRAV